MKHTVSNYKKLFRRVALEGEQGVKEDFELYPADFKIKPFNAHYCKCRRFYRDRNARKGENDPLLKKYLCEDTLTDLYISVQNILASRKALTSSEEESFESLMNSLKLRLETEKAKYEALRNKLEKMPELYLTADETPCELFVFPREPKKYNNSYKTDTTRLGTIESKRPLFCISPSDPRPAKIRFVIEKYDPTTGKYREI